MALAAAQVVDALAARLAPQALGAGGVKTSRLWPWSEDELPACRVFAADEPVEAVGGIAEVINRHELSVDVQYTARATADLDDALHALAEAGLPLLFAAPVPYGLRLTGINRNTTTEGEAAVGQITLQLACTFFVSPAAPHVILS
jgi:hypothetical protein